MSISEETEHPLENLHSFTPVEAGFGLQGRLIGSFLVLLAVALGGSCYLFANQSTDQVTDMMGRQATSIAFTLSLSAEPLVEQNRRGDLDRIGKDLLNSRDLLYVAVLGPDGKPISLARRYVDFDFKDIPPVDANSKSIYAVHPAGKTGSFGQYLDVYAPVTRHSKDGKDTGKLLGYVVVGVTIDAQVAQAQWITWMVVAIGGVVVLLSLPVAYLLVYSIFKPIRKLVDATRKVAAGRNDFSVDAERNDAIGELARSFSDMVTRIRRQRQDLADANYQLGATNKKLADTNDQLAEANMKLSDVNRELEQKVLERTTQLQTANRRLTGEISEKEDFLRAVSHDLNAPLRNIAGMASMLLLKHRAEFSDDVCHRLDRIQKNVQVETDLINELLELSRIKTRRTTPERVDTEALVADIGGVFEQDLQTKQIIFVVDTPLPVLTAERARIRQVIQNLVDNAIKYMGDRGSKEIHVGCNVRPDEAEFYVRDTGIGIEPEDIDKVFHIFRRGKSAATANIPGKGVGLASVKSIVEMYNGTIWVESVFGQGSTFKFTINGKFVGEPPAATEAGPAERHAA
jgi:signal transduction histidine kinase